MSRRTGLLLAVVWLLAACQESVSTSDATTLSSMTHAAIPGDEAPELAKLGAYRVGVQTLKFAYPDSPDVSVASHLGGDVPRWTRRLSVDVLYPAKLEDDIPADAVYAGEYHTGFADIEGLPQTFEIRGLAVRNAPVVSNQQFPLVIVSHGLLNAPGVLSGITENLASKGYVVAVIDHRDAADDPSTPVHLFARVMLNRVLDQRHIVREMRTLAGNDSPLGQAIDAESIGLVGFSMGGYGVLGHAGAGLSADGSALDIVPDEALVGQIHGSHEYDEVDRSYIDAVVAFAPWGGKAGDVWSDEALANIGAPLLILGGSEDDVSDFDLGIRRIFDRSVGTDRYLVVFQNAQHNLVQVPAPPSAHLDVRTWMMFEDPTWRRERLLSVGAHFLTAFLDWHLKGDETRRGYLDVPTVEANDSRWEQPFGSDYSDRYADGADGSEGYWKGFKRRQAIGLEVHHLGLER